MGVLGVRITQLELRYPPEDILLGDKRKRHLWADVEVELGNEVVLMGGF